MESLFKAYSNSSDDYDEEDEPKPKRLALSSSPSKRPEREPFKFKPNLRSLHCSDSNSETHERIMVPGRYVSKRERALLSSTPASRAPDSFPNPSFQTPPGGYDGQPLCLEVSKMHLKYDDGEIVTEAFEAQPNTGPMSHY